MKALIVCTPVSHGNTRRVADRMAEVLSTDVIEPGVGPLRVIGGVNKGQPNQHDLDRAAAFAAHLRNEVWPPETAS